MTRFRTSITTWADFDCLKTQGASPTTRSSFTRRITGEAPVARPSKRFRDANCRRTKAVSEFPRLPGDRDSGCSPVSKHPPSCERWTGTRLWRPLPAFAFLRIESSMVDISPLLKGETRFVPPPGLKKSINADIPLRRRWDPPGEWAPLINRYEYSEAFFYHGSQGAAGGGALAHRKPPESQPAAFTTSQPIPRNNARPQRRDISQASRHGNSVSGRDEARCSTCWRSVAAAC